MHIAKRIASNSFFYTVALMVQKVLSSVYFWYYSNNLPGGAEDLGKMQFILAFVALFFIIGDLGFYLIFLRESSKTPKKTNKFLNTLLCIKLPLMAVASTLILIVGKFYLKDTFILVIPALVWIVLDNFTLVLYAVLRSRQNLKFESLAVIANQLIVITVGLIAIKLNGNVLHLILALVTGTSLNFLFVLSIVIFKLKFKIRLKIDKKIAKAFLVALPGFALTGLIVKMLNSFDTVILQYLSHNFSSVGFYSVPLKLITAITLTLPTALMGALYPVFSHLYYKSSNYLNVVFQKAIEYLIIISVPITFGFWILGGNLIHALWQNEYNASILPAKIMFLALPFIFLTFPTGNLLNASNRQKYTAISRFIGLITMIVIDILLIPKWNIIGAAIALPCTHFTIFLFDIYFLRKRFFVIVSGLAKQLTRVILSSIVMILAIASCAFFMPWYSLIFVGIIIYFSTLWLVKGLDLQFLQHIRS